MAGWLCTIWPQAGIGQTHVLGGGKVVALPSRPLQALSDGKGFKMIGAAVLWKFAIRSWQAPLRDISQIAFLDCLALLFEPFSMV